MKQLTKTRATYRGVDITVSCDRINGRMMYTCRNSAAGVKQEEQWFLTQGEAIANERYVVDRVLGIPSKQEG